MALFSRKSRRKQRNDRLVATGKRINGTWLIESTLTPPAQHREQSVMFGDTQNRPVRTLH